MNTNLRVVVSTPFQFKGIMARISGGDENVNTKEVFIVDDDDLDLQQNSNCDLNVSVVTNPFVGSISRTAPASKLTTTTYFPSFNATSLPYQIGGITHTNSENKQSFEWTMVFTQEATNMLLDMNIVQTKTPVSRFYYDQYVLTAVADLSDLPLTPPVAPPTTPSPQAATTSGAMVFSLVTGSVAMATVVVTLMW